MCKRLLLVFLLMASHVFANVLVKDVEWSNGKAISTLIVKYEGRMADVPNWEVFGKTFIMTIPSAQIGASITKKASDGQLIKVVQKSANEVKLTL